MIIVSNPERWAGQVIGNGHCVRFLQIAGNLPHTTRWRRGPQVRGNQVRPNTAIATFGGNPPHKYTSHTDGSAHAAVFIEELPEGLRVWDQWRGQPVHQRLIQFRGGKGKAVNDGDRFFVILA